MHVQRTKSVADTANFSALVKVPKITVSNFTADNYEIFTTALCSVVGINIGMKVILIDYVMIGVTGNYDSSWKNQEEKLNNFLLHTGNSFNSYNITLYSLYYQYIFTKGVGSNIINK